MKAQSVTPLCRGLAPLLIVLGLVSCTDEETIYVERVLYEDPPTAAQGFLGYDDADKKLTVCGNCHVGQQSRWETTAHADAWETLQDSGHSQAFCEGCHTVGANGNPVTGTAGYAGAPEGRYHDVQCESCHGAGLNHVSNPDDAAAPMASIAIFDSEGNPTQNCAECHSGVHHPFADEWAQSLHARPVSSVVNGTSTSCLGCHTGQGVLKAWGVTSTFVELSAPQAQHVGITCAVCHDPHQKVNDAQLRFPIDVADEENNLCMKCHNRRANPEITSSTIRGAHAPEGSLLLGDAGWWPPNFSPEVDRIVASHGTEGNARLCASCHVTPYEVTDATTGDFVFSATGHLFKAIPCTDENGMPLPEEECPTSERNFDSCAQSGCHLTATAAMNAFNTSNARIASLVADVEQLLTQVPPGEFNLSDGRFTVADGAWFNADLGKKGGSPTHNPFLMEQLLLASIDVLESTYGLAAPTANRERMFR
jgi:predicted CXXCH cytochrome family protein